MERRGGCCIAMCGPAGASANVAWKVGRIMLRYRPIAPRPASASAAVTAAPAELCAPIRRPKRKRGTNPGSVGGGKRRMGKKKQVPTTAASTSSSKVEDEKPSSSLSSSSSTVVTLPLMPETPERKGEPLESPKISPDPTSTPVASAPAWQWQGNGERPATAGLVTAPRPFLALGSWVTVECVTDTWREGEVQWRSDESVRAALAADDCPGFVSDAWDRIIWTNEAYRGMVVGSSISTVASWPGEEEGEDATVGLVTQGLPAAAGPCRAFTCRVRVRYQRRPGRGSTPSLAAPCDVWRMDGGGFAWRLDVKTALSLGLRL